MTAVYGFYELISRSVSLKFLNELESLAFCISFDMISVFCSAKRGERSNLLETRHQLNACVKK